MATKGRRANPPVAAAPIDPPADEFDQPDADEAVEGVDEVEADETATEEQPEQTEKLPEVAPAAGVSPFEKVPPFHQYTANRARLTRESMISIIQGGGSITYRGNVYASVESLPTDEQLDEGGDQKKAMQDSIDMQIAALQAQKASLNR